MDKSTRVKQRTVQRLFVVFGILILGLGHQTYPVQAESIPEPEQLTATARVDGVAIEWQQTEKTPSVRYSLLRGTSNTLADAQPISALLLSSISNATPMTTYYTLLDPSAEAESAYTYWLTLTDGQGQQATFGPYTVGQVDDASQQDHALFLPLISSVAGSS
jgi:hypothetical protein